MRLTDKLDPALLLRSNPSFTETKEYSIETEVSVHRARANEIKRIMRRRVLQFAAIVACAVNGIVVTGANVQTGEMVGLAFGLLLLAVAAGVYGWMRADWEVDELLIQTFRHDIADPQRDSERRAEIEAILAYLREQQPARAPAVVRVESTVREPGRTTVRTVYNDDLPGTIEQWRDLAGLVLRNVAPQPFSLRTAESVGLSRDEWNTARDVFIARGWAEWNHPDAPQQGVTLKLVGKRALREMLAQTEPYEIVPLD